MAAPALSEKQKMLAGDLYDASDTQLRAERLRARSLCQRLNALDPAQAEDRRALLRELLGPGPDADISPPFLCDYGYNIRLGANVYFNVDCVILDVMPVTLGANVLVGPGVHIYAASHPMDAGQRRSGLEFGKAVVIGDDVWIGGGAVICPGVRIGSGAVIGAGSVVTRDIPAGVFAAGNPCRVIPR
jgi:maltose O-acetyltransferase